MHNLSCVCSLAFLRAGLCHGGMIMASDDGMGSLVRGLLFMLRGVSRHIYPLGDSCLLPLADPSCLAG